MMACLSMGKMVEPSTWYPIGRYPLIRFSNIFLKTARTRRGSLGGTSESRCKAYYEILERTQRGSLDVTAWLAWFLGALHRAVDLSQGTLDQVLAKARFWTHWSGVVMNARQIAMLNRFLDGFEGKLTSGKWASLAKCSSDTALRDISELLAHGVLKRSEAGGRSTSYDLMD